MERMLKRLIPVLLALLLLAGCGKSAAAVPDLEAVYERIAAEAELPEMIRLSEKRMDSFYGIDAAACPQAIVAVSDDGLRVDEVWLLEAADEKAAEALLALAQSRIARICAETENYLPDQYAVAQGAEALRIGSCVGLFVSPDAQRMAEIFRQSFAG